MNKRIITYLKQEKNLKQEEINGVLKKLRLNPEDKLSDESKGKIDRELKISHKPQKKIIVKKKKVTKKKKVIRAKTAPEKKDSNQNADSKKYDNKSKSNTSNKDYDDKKKRKVYIKKSGEGSNTSKKYDGKKTTNKTFKNKKYNPKGRSDNRGPSNTNNSNNRNNTRPANNNFKKKFEKKATPDIDITQATKKNTHINKKGKKTRYYKKDKRKELDFKLEQELKKKKAEKAALQSVPAEIEVPDSITVQDLAKKMNLKASVIVKKFFDMGMMVTVNQIIDIDSAEIVASEFNCKINKVSIYDQIEVPKQDDLKSNLKKRPPIVTVMGHVDHGKTTLLDYIRNTKVTTQEAGGITQSIGAYKVGVEGKDIVFIDTPGHEAFTNMRARGAQITDVVILIVAADDGVMPQTKEAIAHAKEAGVPVIVAVNKIDKHNANPEKVKGELAEHEIIPQEWGGDVIFVPVSALNGKGIDELLEAVLLVSEDINLDSDYSKDKWAEGIVLESCVEKGKGTVATVIIKNGILSQRDFFVAGNEYGRVRRMSDDKGKMVKQVGPSTPVEVIGFEGIPEAGDLFNVMPSEKEAKALSKKRKDVETMEKQKKSAVNLDNIFEKIEDGSSAELKIIIRADVQGMAEAMKQAIEKLTIKAIKVNVIQLSVGAITENDVSLASASDAIIIGFNTKPTKRAVEMADESGVDIRRYSIIYDVIEDLKNAMTGLAAPKVREEILGEIEVRQIFKVPGVGVVAGSYVTKGVITRNALCRIFREGKLLYESKVESLNRFKDSVKEVKQGIECGISVKNFNDFREGDVIEAYKKIEEAVSYEELMKNEEERLKAEKAEKDEKEKKEKKDKESKK